MQKTNYPTVYLSALKVIVTIIGGLLYLNTTVLNWLPLAEKKERVLHEMPKIIRSDSPHYARLYTMSPHQSHKLLHLLFCNQ